MKKIPNTHSEKPSELWYEQAMEIARVANPLVSAGDFSRPIALEPSRSDEVRKAVPGAADSPPKR
jgi:hypothetical protein